ncbi:MAG: triose-phosphate isomerase [Polyangiaceae bacterium]|nr:triose-phosphate isomerase [Polyangiaceae bacterium]
MALRTPIIAGNWKLHMGPAAAGALAGYLRDALEPGGGARSGGELVVFPTALSIPSVVAALAGSRIAVGIQEVAAKPTGALTGANSAVMAREAGCTWMLTGHSERRQFFAETDQGVRDKVKAGLAAGLRVMVCIGETLDERKAGRVEEVTRRQLGVALEGLPASALAELAVAYEPVWAIGTGVTATPEQAEEAHASIRAYLRTLYPAEADAMRLLYGGSVKADNAATLLGQPDIDGALVGGASLEVASFAAIVGAAGAA